LPVIIAELSLLSLSSSSLTLDSSGLATSHTPTLPKGAA
jgi:hypothetical protein